MNAEGNGIVITEQENVEFEEQDLIPGGPAIPATTPPTRPSVPADQQAYNPLDLPSDIFNANLERRKRNRASFLSWVRSALVDDVDFGQVKTKRGMSKPSLRKPGAEKICGMLGVTAHFPALPDYERVALSSATLENIILRCELKEASGRVVADGVGARSLKQDYGDLNKALKMAEKSGHIDATLRMGGLSEIFTQDLEDMNLDVVNGGSVTNAPSLADKIQITDQQIREMEKLLDDANADYGKFITFYKVGDIKDLNQEQFFTAVALLKKKIERQAL